MRKGVWGTEQKRKREGVDGWGRALCVAEEEGRDGEEWGKTELEISKFGLGRGMGGGKVSTEIASPPPNPMPREWDPQSKIWHQRQMEETNGGGGVEGRRAKRHPKFPFWRQSH